MLYVRSQLPTGTGPTTNVALTSVQLHDERLQKPTPVLTDEQLQHYRSKRACCCFYARNFQRQPGEQAADLAEERTARVVRWRWLHAFYPCPIP